MDKTQSITNFFEVDHHEIDAIFDQISFKDPSKDLSLFEEFDHRLERHIHWEEDLLFSAIGKVAPMIEQGPVRIMKIEHEGIRNSKAKAKVAFKNGDLVAAQEHCQAMKEMLAQHNFKEEGILYPACDQSLDKERIAEIFSRIELQK